MAKAIGQFTIYDFHDVYSSPTAPTKPIKDMLWLDTSVKPPLMRVWNGTGWEVANDFEVGIRNKVRNSAFLKGKESWNLSTNVTIDTNRTLEGNPSCKSSQSGLAEDAWRGCVNYSIPDENTTLIKGVTYTVSCYYFVEDRSIIDRGIALECKGRKVGSTSSSENGIISITVDGDKIVEGKWTKITGTFTPSYDFERSCVRAYVRRNGIAWFTNFTLVNGNKSGDWTVAPEDINSSIESIKEITESNSTTINVMQGQIETAINNTKIVKDGQTILLKDDYNRTVTKVDSINSTIGTHTTKINELTGSITSVDTKVNSVQRDLEGTKSTVSSHTSQINGLNSTVSTQGASINQLKNEISLKVEQTDINNAVTSLKIGGDNVLRNGNFTYSMSDWSVHDMSSGGTSKSVTVENGGGDWKPDNKKVLVIRGTNTTNRYGVISSTIKLIPKTKYTISGYCAGHRVNKIQVNVRDRQGSDANIHTIDINPVSGGSTLDKWCRFETTFTTTSNTDFALNLYSVNFADNGYVWFCDVQIQQGTKASAWIPCSADIDNYISNVQTQVTTTSNKVATIETNLNSITQRVSSTESTVSTHTSQLSTVDSRINTAKNSAISTAASDATTKVNTAQTNAINSAKGYTDGQITTVNQTITTKLAEIKATTDSITSKVQSIENTTTTINGNVTSLQSRMNTAEQKITPTAIVNTISSTITGGTGSISTTQFIMDKNGLTIKNGALKIQNKSGTTVFNSDTNGNLIITGTLKSQKGDMFVALDSGGVTFQDWNRKEQMLRMAMTSFSSNRDYNGVTFAMPQYSDFIRFSYVSKSDLTNGWSSSDTQYSFFDLWSGDRTIEGKTFKKGINIHAPMYVGTNGILLDSGNAHTSDLKGNLTWNTINGLMGVMGDNGCFLGYKNGEAYNARLVITEGAHPGTGDNIRSYGNWNASAYTIHNAHFNGLSLTIKGSKNCIQETKNYGERLINAYETAEYFYGDLGFGKINEDGECLIYIDDIFSECVNTDIEYHVFTQAYTGLIKTIERCKTYFIVRGDAGTEFSWEFKAKRPGYEENRLDIMSEENQGENETELEDLLLMEGIA